MKKLLSLLGVFSLSATSATGVVSCKPKTKTNDENTEEQRIKDLETLQKIAIMAKNDLNEQLFKNNIDSNNVSLLTEIYQTVNKDKTSYVLEQVKDVNIISYFNTVLNVVFDNINRKIAHEYSNYYHDSLPLSYDKTDV
ncbi:lipoprotein [Spiroplasma endosymbiont of Stenodema calcarata]|uniref:lipoprotein n=1 Tax=Spiroplasma endosymbiont of Stenodema calcarata TaxID=3139328 RepID=UPI003CCAFC33